MTKEITKAIILQAIQDKMKLREFAPSPFLFDETVVPVYNIGEHFRKVERLTVTQVINSTGARKFWDIPETQQWELHRYNVLFLTGSFTIAGLFLGRPADPDYVYLDLKAAQNVSYANDLPKPAILRAGDSIWINVDGYTSTGNLMVIADVIKEEIR